MKREYLTQKERDAANARIIARTLEDIRKLETGLSGDRATIKDEPSKSQYITYAHFIEIALSHMQRFSDFHEVIGELRDRYEKARKLYEEAGILPFRFPCAAGMETRR